MIYLMSLFVKLIHSLFITDYFLIFLQLFNGFHMLLRALTHVHLVNLTHHKKVEVYKVKIYLLFTTVPLPLSTFSRGNHSYKVCVYSFGLFLFVFKHASML